MHFAALLLLSFVVHSSTDVLQVKCGDEKCERPSNKAVTTLRYTPDKPYKLQILAVNAEVEIFGMTDDLYYIRHGKNYGFLPKNHLREKARGNYPFNVEIDISNKRIDQQIREKNFLYEFLKANTAEQIVDPSMNNTLVEEMPNNVNETTEEPPLIPPTNDSSTQNQPVEIPSDEKIMPSSDSEALKTDKQPSVSQEEPDDAGEDGDDEEEEEEESIEKNSEENRKLLHEQEQPQLIVSPNVVSDQQPSDDLKIVAEVVETVPTPESTGTQYEVVQEKTETVPEFVPMKPQVVEETVPELSGNENIAPQLGQTVEPNKSEQIDQQIEISTPPPITQSPLQAQDQQNPKDQPQSEIYNGSISGQPTIDVNPALDNPVQVVENVTEQQSDKKEEMVADLGGTVAVESELPDVPFQFETPQSTESSTENQLDGEQKVDLPSDLPQVEVPLVTVTPEVPLVPVIPEVPLVQVIPEVPLVPVIPEVPLVTVTPEIEENVLPNTNEEAATPPPQHKVSNPEPDALLQRFNEKLGNRGVENTGKVPVEPVENIEKVDHIHVHDEQHETIIQSESEKKSEPEMIEEEENQPGFFSGLYSRFFSDNDSEQHSHSELNTENTFNPTTNSEAESEFCEKIDSENCPQSLRSEAKVKVERDPDWKTADEYLRIVLNETIEMMDLIVSMGLTSLTVLIFTLGYYCINKARKEGPLIAKMNELERHLMASGKENEILKGDVISTRQKLLSIEDNSFGSNDMVIALRRDLDTSEQVKSELLEKIASLEKDLEAAAEDGLELNKMVSELLNNQTGSESIISTVEDLQRQLNEQQETIVTMNEALAAKSRENSELRVQLSEINGKFEGDYQTLQQQAEAFALERSNLKIELENLKLESDAQVSQLIEERNSEVTRLNKELTSYAKSYEDSKKSLTTAESKVQALEECLKAVKNDSSGSTFKELFDVAELKADLLAVTKEKSTIQEQLQVEKDSRKLLEDRVKSISEDMSDLKKELGIAEKEKLEAQTRLEVLSTYFKEKETQLQQELSVKEARWMKQQGETTSTVEKVQALNLEIQELKSQNDSLRAEIEAQVTAHKLNISQHEAQSHAAWLNARQAERKLEDSRMESAALRKRLTSIAENPGSDMHNGQAGIFSDTMNSLPSPIRVESPNNPNNLPPAPMMMPPFLSQGFMSGVPPFMPPPPFMPGEMVPPLGRLMSPPPKRFTPTMRDERDRFSPRGRGRYSPDSRYDDYTAFETETDYSPPPSPGPLRRGYNSPSDRSKKSKGHNSATSIESSQLSRRK